MECQDPPSAFRPFRALKCESTQHTKLIDPMSRQHLRLTVVQTSPEESVYIYIWGNVACTYSIHFFYIFIHSIHIYYTFINTHNAQAVQIYTTEIVIAESRISPLVSEKAGDSRFGCRYSHLFSLLMKNLDVKL